jgi:TPR repeat protein
MVGAALAAALVGTVISGAALSGPLEDAAAAYNRGDDTTVMRIIRPLAHQGNATAQVRLGVMYYHGRGVPQNYPEAVKWFLKAADQGNAGAQYNLGVMYAKGQGLPQNYPEAVKWYRKAADQGNAGAQANLGVMYDNGRGVPQNYTEAVKWYRKAADQGNAEAQANLGVMYESGQSVPQNYLEAVKWFRKAADQGNAEAQANLGVMYYDGRGVAQNYVQAHMWWNLAASGSASNKANRAKAAKNREIVATKMTPAQIARAQAMAELCLRSNYRDCGSSQVARREDRAAPPPPAAARSEVASTGSGFFVSENGHIVTNAHVGDVCQNVRSSRGGSLRKVSTDNESDLALYIASEKPDSIAHVRGGRGARVGEAVVAVGFPLSGLLSSDPIVTTGTISALSGLGNDRRMIQISAPVQPGNSGGPLLGEDGSIVGVVVGKIDAVKVAKAIGDIPQNVNFAVSLGTLQSFLNANGVAYALDDSKGTKSPPDIAAEASRYIVLLECLK